MSAADHAQSARRGGVRRRSTGTQTPMMTQYLKLKAEVGEAILFYRMGDFYEMFFEDAIVAAEVCDLTLTSRNKSDPEPIPMADVFDWLKAALANRHVVEREIGSGGMATVYLAEDLKLHRKVALKALRPELAAVSQ